MDATQHLAVRWVEPAEVAHGEDELRCHEAAEVRRRGSPPEPVAVADDVVLDGVRRLLGLHDLGVMPIRRRPPCERCGGFVALLPGLRSRTVACLGRGHCAPCCAECGVEMVLRDGDDDERAYYDGDCEHMPSVRAASLERDPRG
jgi:hypothetical protein